jgi:hypothetical protein
VDVGWKDAQTVTATVRALISGEHQFRPPANFSFVPVAEAKPEPDGAITLRVEKGRRYRLQATPP